MSNDSSSYYTIMVYFGFVLFDEESVEDFNVINLLFIIIKISIKMSTLIFYMYGVNIE